MHRDAPELPEILRTAREFIDEITDRLSGQDRYHALCTSYLLAVAERELADGPAVDDAERAVFSEWAGDTATLAAQIRSGALDAQWDRLFPQLLTHVINKVRISKPEHLHPMHREG